MAAGSSANLKDLIQKEVKSGSEDYHKNVKELCKFSIHQFKFKNDRWTKIGNAEEIFYGKENSLALKSSSSSTFFDKKMVQKKITITPPTTHHTIQRKRKLKLLSG